jgi:diguanylate cyclase (GGDEF)-like protein
MRSTLSVVCFTLVRPPIDYSTCVEFGTKTVQWLYLSMNQNIFKNYLGYKIGMRVLLATLVPFSILGVLIFALGDQWQIRPIVTYSIFALFFLFWVALLIPLVCNHLIERPLRKLKDVMKRVEDGHLKVSYDTCSSDEFDELGSRFNRMVKSLNELNHNRRVVEHKIIQAEENLKYRSDLQNKAHLIERMNQELSDAFNDVSLLYTVSQYLGSVLDSEDIPKIVKKIFAEKFRCDHFALYFKKPESNQLSLVISEGHENNKKDEITIGRGIAGQVALQKSPIYLGDIEELLAYQLSDLERGYQGSVFSLPLLIGTELIGVLTVTRKGKDSLTPTDRQSLESISSQVAVAYDRASLHMQTKELSVRDELTGAYNRRYFRKMLEIEMKRAERANSHVSLLIMDVDHFKNFNDTYGHLQGDRMLKRLTEVIQENIRASDVLARFGGEEFVVMLPDTTLYEASKTAHKIQALMAQNLWIELGEGSLPKQASTTVSIGISSSPQPATDIDSLIHTADIALYEAKEGGRNQVKCYQVNNLSIATHLKTVSG